jgi:prepilin signal peptidase PulO-like enzyme (type II secretory pathway)
LAILAPFVIRGVWGEADALLLATIGAWTTWQFVLTAAFWAGIAGAAIALVYAVRCLKGKDWRRRVYAYVPAITLGTAIAALIS